MTGRWMEELRNTVPTAGLDDDADAFAAQLRQRAEGARKVEQGLLTEVPMLYGSAGPNEPEGDPGIVIARLHREELLRRSGAMPLSRTEEPPVRLSYERFRIAIGLIAEALYFSDLTDRSGASLQRIVATSNRRSFGSVMWS